MTWSAPFVDSGTLTYSVDGVSQTKALVRGFLAKDDLTGSYLGSIRSTVTGCSDPLLNGTAAVFATVTITQSGPQVTMTTAAQSGGSCTVQGRQSQAGQFARVDGTYSCSTGEIGHIAMFEIYRAWNHIAGRYTTSQANNGCVENAGFVGIDN